MTCHTCHTYVVESCSYAVCRRAIPTTVLDIFWQRCIQQRLRVHTLRRAQCTDEPQHNVSVVQAVGCRRQHCEASRSSCTKTLTPAVLPIRDQRSTVSQS